VLSVNDQSLTHAKKAVKDILAALEVARVIYVDDANGKDVSLEDVIAAVLVLPASELLAAFPDLSVIPDDQDALSQKVRDLWGRMDEDYQVRQGNAVIVAARRQDANSTDDVADAFILSDLIPKEKLVNLSPSQWDAQKEQLLQDSLENRTLFLFDQDLSEAGGDREGGMKTIASLLARQDANGLLCGLLTHTVTPESQPQQWKALSEQYGISRDRFVVIPKLHLSQAPILFARILKFAALLPDFAELKRQAKEIIVRAASVAADRVDGVSIYDLDHIVFEVSANEGLWEPDMLFRLHALFHRLASRQLAHEGGTLESIAAKLRAVSGIPTRCDLFPPPSTAWALQREELYELDDYINRCHLPLELGDIFEKVDMASTKKYVLLAQPCDLMVRRNGERQPDLCHIPVAEVATEEEASPASEEHHEPQRVALAEVVTTEKAPRYCEHMPYFGNSPSQKWYVNFKRIHFVRLSILDLCVFNEDGIARLIVGGSAPSGIRPPWKARHGVLSKQFQRRVRKAGVLCPDANEPGEVTQYKKKISQEIGSLFFGDDLFKGAVEMTNGTSTVSFDCRRVGRVSRARALGLLMSYTSTLGRPAYDPLM